MQAEPWVPTDMHSSTWRGLKDVVNHLVNAEVKLKPN